MSRGAINAQPQLETWLHSGRDEADGGVGVVGVRVVSFAAGGGLRLPVGRLPAARRERNCCNESTSKTLLKAAVRCSSRTAPFTSLSAPSFSH